VAKVKIGGVGMHLNDKRGTLKEAGVKQVMELYNLLKSGMVECSSGEL